MLVQCTTFIALRELKEFLKLLTIHVAVTKNFGEQYWPNGFARVNWHYCRAAILMMEKFKTSLFQHRQ